GDEPRLLEGLGIRERPCLHLWSARISNLGCVSPRYVRTSPFRAIPARCYLLLSPLSPHRTESVGSELAKLQTFGLGLIRLCTFLVFFPLPRCLSSRAALAAARIANFSPSQK